MFSVWSANYDASAELSYLILIADDDRDRYVIR